MRSYYSLPLLCLTLCAVAKCEIATTRLVCPSEKLSGQTKNSPAIDYYCADGAPADYDQQSARDHCCTVPLRRGQCPGECRKLRSKRSTGNPEPEPEPVTRRTYPWRRPRLR